MREILSNQRKLFIIYKLTFLGAIILTLSLSAFSQSVEKCFQGSVKDANNAVIIGANVLLKNINGKIIEQTQTDLNGEFRLSCFEKGEYFLTISNDGMSEVEKKIDFTKENLQVSDIVLETQGISEVVQVEIEPAFITSISQTVTKTATPLRDIPQSVEIVNRQLIDSQAVRSMQDALYNVTAVSVAQGEGRRDQFFIRGFSAIGDQFVDGVRDDALYYRDLANIEQIEVVKGPSAALFGRGSSGGIINRVTKKPDLYQRLGTFEGIFGSYGLKRGNFDFGSPILSEKLAFRFVGAYEETGSFRHFFKENRYNIAPSLAWRPTEKTDVTFQFEYLNDTRVPDRGIPSFRGRAGNLPIGTYYGFPKEDEITNKVNSQALKIEHQLTSFWTIRNNFRRIDYDTDYYTTYSNGICLLLANNSCTSSIPDNISENDENLRVVRGQYSGYFKQKNYFNQTEIVGIVETAGIQHTVLGGVEFGFQKKNTLRTNNTTPNRVALINPDLSLRVADGSLRDLDEFDGRTVGIYFQDQITFNKNWKALIGARYDDFKQKVNDLLPSDEDLARTDKQWSPRLGLVYQPNEMLSFYGSYSRSFQPSGENLSLAANNEELGPETTQNYEAGVKATFQPIKLNATLAVFRLNRDNIKTNDPLNPGQLILVGEQRTNGLELNFSGSPFEKFDFVAGYSLLDARITKSNSFSGGVPLEGRFAQLTPRNSGNLWLTYQLPKQFRLGFGGNVRSKTFTSTNNLVTLPGYSRFDAFVSWRSEKHYEVAFNLKNILNRKYFETAHNDNQIMPGAPINGSISLRYRW
jgi:catecholate siderophore receptor